MIPLKKVFLLFFFISFIVIGCSQVDYMELNDNTINQKTSEEVELPLEGKNVFDPKTIKVGDMVQDFVLSEIQVFPGTQDYPIDTLSAKFKGKTMLKGDMFYIKADGEFVFEDYLKFSPDKISQLKLPISHHESEGRDIVFFNQTEAISLVNMKPGETKLNVTVEIEDYTINYLPTDAENTAILLNIISSGE